MITIVKAQCEDLSGLALLLPQLINKESHPDEMKNIFNLIDSDHRYLLLVAKDSQNKVLGTAMGILCYDLVGSCRPFMLIENVVVDSRFRSQGIGRILMSSLESFARESQCTYIVLFSGSERKEAHQFYESLGFSIDKVKGFKKDLY